jgi:hypothetical protein
LAPFNALMSVLAVNGLDKAFGSTPATDTPKSPSGGSTAEGEFAGYGGGDDGRYMGTFRADPFANEGLAFKLAVAGSFVKVGWELAEVGLHLGKVAGLTGWGAGAAAALLIVGALFIIGGGLYGAAATYDSYRGRPRRRRRQRRSHASPWSNMRGGHDVPGVVIGGCPA